MTNANRFYVMNTFAFIRFIIIIAKKIKCTQVYALEQALIYIGCPIFLQISNNQISENNKILEKNVSYKNFMTLKEIYDVISISFNNYLRFK